MVHQLGDNNPDGMNIALSSSEKVSFYGVTPIVQRTASVQAALVSASAGVANSAGGTFAYTTSAQANGITDQLNEVRNTLVAYGLWKGS